MTASKKGFNVGDRVSVRGEIDMRKFKDAVGIIVNIDEDLSLEVAFDAWSNGHDGNVGDRNIRNRWFIAPRHHRKVTVIKDKRHDIDPIIDVHALLPLDAKKRKEIPLASGMLDYFTSALIEVAKVSFKGNEQHNPGQPMHWARDKSSDHADTMLRHFMERGTFDSDGTRHAAKMVWRALALLQMELEEHGYPKARGAR